MLKILFLTHRFPFPPDRGDRIRSNAIIRHLAERHRVSLASVVDRTPEESHLRAAESLCASVDVGASSRLRRLAAPCYLPTAVPLTLPLLFSRDLQARITRRLRTETFDLIFIYSSSMAPYVLGKTTVPAVVDFIDVDSEKWLDYARTTRFPMKAIYWREGVCLRRYERRIVQASAHAFVASEREAGILRSIAPGVPVTAILNGVIAAPRPGAPRESRKLVFTGVMDYWPNVDAVTYLARDIWPAIRTAVPDAELVIVGQSPSRHVRRLAAIPGVTVTGWVADVGAYLADAAAFVAPLRLARGIQNKILEAMAVGVPVVTSPAGLAGFDAMPGRDLLVADTPTLFAAHTVSLLLDADLRDRLSRSAQDFVRQHHRWDHKLHQMERIVRDVAAGRRTAHAAA